MWCAIVTWFAGLRVAVPWSGAAAVSGLLLPTRVDPCYRASSERWPHPWAGWHLKPWMLFFVYSSWVPRLCFLVCVSVFGWDFFANTITLSRFLVLGFFCLVYHPSSQILGDFEVQIESYIHNFQILWFGFFLWCALLFVALWSSSSLKTHWLIYVLTSMILHSFHWFSCDSLNIYCVFWWYQQVGKQVSICEGFIYWARVIHLELKFIGLSELDVVTLSTGLPKVRS